MKRSRFTETQIVSILKEADAGMKIKDLCRKHDEEDELFLVLNGELRIEYEDHVVTLGAGDFHIVPKGVMHNPVCDEECLNALIETVTTKHTGDTQTAKTKSIDEQLGGAEDLSSGDR